nr:hypothetical protein CFP56_13493 [Quercus suber]
MRYTSVRQDQNLWPKFVLFRLERVEYSEEIHHCLLEFGNQPPTCVQHRHQVQCIRCHVYDQGVRCYTRSVFLRFSKGPSSIGVVHYQWMNGHMPRRMHVSAASALPPNSLRSAPQCRSKSCHPRSVVDDLDTKRFYGHSQPSSYVQSAELSFEPQGSKATTLGLGRPIEGPIVLTLPTYLVQRRNNAGRRMVLQPHC